MNGDSASFVRGCQDSLLSSSGFGTRFQATERSQLPITRPTRVPKPQLSQDKGKACSEDTEHSRLLLRHMCGGKKSTSDTTRK